MAMTPYPQASAAHVPLWALITFTGILTQGLVAHLVATSELAPPAPRPFPSPAPRPTPQPATPPPPLPTEAVRPPPLPLRPAVPDFQPEAVRRSAPALARDSPELRCDERIPPESHITSKAAGGAAVAIYARATYTGTPSPDVHAWSVEVQITNVGAVPVRPLSVHWVIATDEGATTELQGPAWRGELPVIPSGEKWTITETVRLAKSRAGSMRGTFQLEKDAVPIDADDEADKAAARPVEAFNARVARLALSSKGRAELVRAWLRRVRPAREAASATPVELAEGFWRFAPGAPKPRRGPVCAARRCRAARR